MRAFKAHSNKCQLTKITNNTTKSIRKLSYDNNNANVSPNDNYAVNLNASVIGPSWSSGNPRPHPVLIFHGLFGSGNNWRSVAKRLNQIINPHHNTGAMQIHMHPKTTESQKRMEFHLIDLRNHGESPWTGGMQFQGMVNDVTHYMDKHSLEKVSIIGHSMGGRLAMQVALLYPHLVQNLVVADVAPVTYPPFNTFNNYISIMKQMDLARCQSRKDADEMLKPLIADPGIRLFLLTNLTERPGINGFTWKLNLDTIQKSLGELRKFEVPSNARFLGPTLLVGGKNSDYIKPEHYPTIKGFFPSSEIEMIEGAGHWVHADKPEVFVQHVSKFLTKQ